VKLELTIKNLNPLEFTHPIRRFSVAEYHKMIDTSIIYEGERVELIDGVITKMPAQRYKHRIVTRKFSEQFYQIVLERKALLYVQSPVTLNDCTEPEPDLALVKYREDEYPEGHPTAKDVLFLIEVSDSTLGMDKAIKLPRYAASGISEVWIANLVDDRIEVYQNPTPLPDGTAIYQTQTDFASGDVLSSNALPDVQISVDDVLI
jgi:Uma2 family endonuclease